MYRDMKIMDDLMIKFPFIIYKENESNSDDDFR